jgi:hypothetical protein
MFDGKAFGLEIVGVVKEFVGKELTPLLSRIDAIERRLNELPAPRDGKDADLGEVRQIIAEEISGLKAAIEAIELPALPDIPAIVTEEVQKAVSAIPAPQDGKSVTVEEIIPVIVSEIEKRVSELPAPKDGEPGKDGAGLAGAIIDRSGELVVTLTNGETRNLGPVVGKDGEPGKPGTDGFGFDDLEASYDGEKTVTLTFTKGERVKEYAFTLPVVIDRGIYAEGKDYKAGDGATWGGSFWIAQKDTSSKPGEGGDWRLAVKKGRDGRDGVVKDAKPSEPVRVGVPGKVA